MISDEQRKIMYNGLATKGRLVADADELAKIDKRLETEPLNYYLWCARGIVSGSIEQAIESYSTALSIRPLSPNTLYNRARRYTGMNRFHEALADFKLSVLLDPEDGWKWHFQGVALYFLSRYTEAVDSFKQAIEANKNNGEALLPFETDWLWNCYCKLGDFESAAKCLEPVGPDTPVLQSEATYKRRILVYRGFITPQEFLDGIDYEDDLEVGNQLYGLANYYYYIVGDNAKSVKYLGEVLANEMAKSGWGAKMALRDMPLRQAEMYTSK